MIISTLIFFTSDSSWNSRDEDLSISTSVSLSHFSMDEQILLNLAIHLDFSLHKEERVLCILLRTKATYFNSIELRQFHRTQDRISFSLTGTRNYMESSEKNHIYNL